MKLDGAFDRSVWRHSWWLVPAMILYLGFLSAWQFNFPTNSSTPFHLLQADAFLEGRLDIQPGKYRYDLAFRDGKWLTYWGYVPATLLLPFRWALGTSLTDRAVAAALSLMTLVVWFAFLMRLQTRLVEKLQVWELILLTCYCGLGQVTYNLALTPIGCYTNHLFAVFFSAWALTLALQPSRKNILWATVLFSLACMTRMSMFLIAPPFVLMMVILWIGPNLAAYKERKVITLVASCALIVFVAGCLHMLTNYVRFGGPLDFGSSYVPGYQNDVKPTYSWQYVTNSLYIYLGSPLQFSLTKPYIKAALDGNAIWSYQFGVFLPLFVAAYFGLTKKPNEALTSRFKSAPFFLAVLGLSSVVIWLFYFVHLLFLRYTGGINFGGRYLSDIQPFFLVVVILSYLLIRRQPLLRGLAVACFVLSMVVEILSPRMVL